MAGGGLRRRGYAAAANEAVDSISNFIFSVWVAREVNAPEFGAFAIAYSIVQISIGVSQGVASMPMMVRYATSSWRTSRKVAGEVTGATLVVSLLPVLVFVAVAGAYLGHPLASCALAFAAVVPGLLLQNCCVLTFYNREQAHLALVNNLIWLVLQLPLFLVLPKVVGSHHAWVYILGWGIAAYIATGVSLIQMRVYPRVDRFMRWFRRRRAAIIDLSVENLVNRVSTQSATWALAASSGLSEGTRLFARRPRALVAFIRVWAVANTALCAAIGIGLAVMPNRFGHDMAGASWQYARPLLFYVVLITIGNAVLVPAQTGLKCLGVTRVSATVRTATAPLPALGAILGGVLGNGTSAVIGMAVGSMISGVVAHSVFERQFAKLTGSVTPRGRIGRHAAPA
jgi:O-antigen/teichoic acid export membrane protein